jgi:hypothetical protein
MTSYVFDMITDSGTIDTFELGAFDSDLEALRHAGRTLRCSPVAFAVDVWCDGIRIGRLRRDAPPPASSGSAAA